MVVGPAEVIALQLPLTCCRILGWSMSGKWQWEENKICKYSWMKLHSLWSCFVLFFQGCSICQKEVMPRGLQIFFNYTKHRRHCLIVLERLLPDLLPSPVEWKVSFTFLLTKHGGRSFSHFLWTLALCRSLEHLLSLQQWLFMSSRLTLSSFSFKLLRHFAFHSFEDKRSKSRPVSHLSH